MKIKEYMSVFLYLILISCENNSSKGRIIVVDKKLELPTTKVEVMKEPKIAGIYSGSDNLGMITTIILKPNGVLIIQASVGDGQPTYSRWSGNYDDLSLFNPKDDFGREQLIGNAEVSERGLQIIGAKFYTRQ
jgi:hypothetical protein